ncbi:MAG: hypothetical protein HYS12_04910 [Planctomycetes bacterium]|nr:hypothetical protein [Planctomycetota bacterium]
MKVSYTPVPVRQPVPSLGGSRIRNRPLLPVLLTGPGGSRIHDGLLDTGADDTVFAEAIAGLLALDLTQAPELQIRLAGRPQPVRTRYVPVLLRISDGVGETYEWTAVVGFVAGPLHYNLLGHAGFLQFFSADFDGDSQVVTLTPRPSFPGQKI